MSKITGILLAAGQSTRFGTNKLIHVLDNGKTIALQAAETLLQACPHSIAVISPDSTRLLKLFTNNHYTVITNTRSHNGMGSSIACAINEIKKTDACLIALADMPFIKVETINSISQQLNNNKCIIAPTYKGKRGHPVLFSKHFFPELAELCNDKGARDIIKNNKKYLKLIDVNDAGIIKDIDTISDIN
ncbi:MAG: nucleotidyltransferase family protein [endosymbiont of Galathealinum brachiosum]|uniref:Nucleotidyltransferase family protein n=1 Tax=endosymbiont of Galathealinum brachiosum TaxID=2200906 RepID=A0A370DLE4_9GAMM|nr:MAG: nucleotidyltransferase family protein [endosymbiont of Galathealinum brachiosum]